MRGRKGLPGRTFFLLYSFWVVDFHAFLLLTLNSFYSPGVGGVGQEQRLPCGGSEGIRGWARLRAPQVEQKLTVSLPSSPKFWGVEIIFSGFDWVRRSSMRLRRWCRKQRGPRTGRPPDTTSVAGE